MCTPVGEDLCHYDFLAYRGYNAKLLFLGGLQLLIRICLCPVSVLELGGGTQIAECAMEAG